MTLATHSDARRHSFLPEDVGHNTMVHNKCQKRGNAYQLLTPVMTSFPLVKSNAVHRGLSSLIVMAANLLLSYVEQGSSVASKDRLMGMLLACNMDVDTMLCTVVGEACTDDTA